MLSKTSIQIVVAAVALALPVTRLQADPTALVDGPAGPRPQPRHPRPLTRKTSRARLNCRHTLLKGRRNNNPRRRRISNPIRTRPRRSRDQWRMQRDIRPDVNDGDKNTSATAQGRGLLVGDPHFPGLGELVAQFDSVQRSLPLCGHLCRAGAGA